jgi:tetratricopeptide (TPR) repeat protein
MPKGTAASLWRSFCLLIPILTLVAAPVTTKDLEGARDRQDLTALDGSIAQLKQSNATPYQIALAYSYAAEVAMELHDKRKSESYAEAGMDLAQKAVAENGSNAEYHRLLGNLCGQVIPANPLMGALKYGQCARDEINKAIALDGKLALAYVSQGVGNYYLPSAMGGGPDTAIKDFDHAIALNPQLAEAYLWKGIALRKLNRDADARQALEKAVQLDPERQWAKQELEKTPAK